jgi:hypothetical protein
VDWSQGDTIEDMFFQARKEFAKPFFAEVVILACWHIWKQRNNKFFLAYSAFFWSMESTVCA